MLIFSKVASLVFVLFSQPMQKFDLFLNAGWVFSYDSIDLSLVARTQVSILAGLFFFYITLIL